MSEKRHHSQIRTETTSLLPPLAIGVLLILLNAYWIALVSGIHHSLNPAYASLFIAPIVNLFLAVLINTLLKRIRPQLALNRAQLLLVYQMLVMLCVVSGHNPMDFILGILAHPFWFATFENEYATLFHRYIPPWLTVQDKGALTGFFGGNSTLYTSRHLLAWIGPVLLWSFVTFVLFFILMCFNSIQRLQWSERERLSYPIAQLPIEMTTPRFFSKKLLWLGIGICAAIELLNGFHFLYPFVPGVPLKIPDFGAKLFTSETLERHWMVTTLLLPLGHRIDLLRTARTLVFGLVLFSIYKISVNCREHRRMEIAARFPILQPTRNRRMVDTRNSNPMDKS